jgi:hypothetical protein
MGTQIATAGTPGLTGPAAPSQQPPALAFAAIYIASKNPMMLPLFNMRPSGLQNPMLTQAQVNTLVNQCLAAGILIDEEIDFWGWDPWTVMSDRLMQGILWVPAGLGNATGTSVITPGEFSGPQPPGTIKVSITASDYPAWPVTAPATTVPTSVGPQIVGPYYELFGPAPPLGTVQGNYKLVQIPSMFMIGGSLMTVWQLMS